MQAGEHVGRGQGREYEQDTNAVGAEGVGEGSAGCAGGHEGGGQALLEEGGTERTNKQNETG